MIISYYIWTIFETTKVQLFEYIFNIFILWNNEYCNNTYIYILLLIRDKFHFFIYKNSHKHIMFIIHKQLKCIFNMCIWLYTFHANCYIFSDVLNLLKYFRKIKIIITHICQICILYWIVNLPHFYFYILFSYEFQDERKGLK